MPLTQEQIRELKKQLLEQIQHLPPDQKAEAQKQIDEMSAEALETMLMQQQAKQQQKIFRMIINNEIPSVKIAENQQAIAVLSTKSLSKGHTIIIPKSPIENEAQLTKEIHDLSEQLSRKILESLKPKSTSIISEKAFGEVILHIIPLYDKPINLQSPREDIPIEELEKIRNQINIEKITKQPVEIIKKEKPKRKPRPLKLKRRIP